LSGAPTPDIQRLVTLLFKEALTLSEISEKMNYPIRSILFLINKTRAAGYTVFAHPTVPFTTFSFIPPKEAR
jgi:hypothetical protein